MRVYEGNENVVVSGGPQIADELRDALALYLETRPCPAFDHITLTLLRFRPNTTGR